MWTVNLDYKNCKCRKSLVDKLVEECNENTDEKEWHPMQLHSNKMIYNSTLNNYEKYLVHAQYTFCFLLYLS